MSAISFVLVAATCLTCSVLAEAIPNVAFHVPFENPTHALIDLTTPSNVFILVEMHGTQPAPQIAGALLAPLARLGRGVLPRATPPMFLVAQITNPPKVENAALREELLKRAREDQAIRKDLIAAGFDKPNEELRARMIQIDADNQARLQAIVKEHGWPTAELVGRDAVQEAFLLVQHSPDAAFQKEMLPLIEKSYKAGELEGQSYALLADRVRVREGKTQIYGTQARPIEEWKNKEPSLMPIEDETHVEKRRVEVGLPPLALYLKMLKQVYFPEPTPP